MKAVLGILALLSLVYGLAFAGVIPVQKLAAKSPALSKALVALHLARPRPKTPLAATQLASAKPVAGPAQQQIAAERAQLDHDKAAFAAQQQAALAAASAPAPGAAPAPDTGAKLTALYAAMDPDDLAPIFAKLSDPQVIGALVQMNAKKAGAVFAALPPDRAARLSQIMASRSPTRPAPAPASAAATPRPATTL